MLQAIYAEDYRGGAVTFGAEVRTDHRTEQARLRLSVIRHESRDEPHREDHGVTVSGPTEWTRHEITALVPGDANMILFGIELTGPGVVALRNPALRQADAMNEGISDGDLVRLARDGDAVAFRLLVERHLPLARAAPGGCAPTRATWTTSCR